VRTWRAISRSSRAAITRGHARPRAGLPVAGSRHRRTGAGAPLVGLRKDRTTFPAEISLSPVPAAAGHFTLAVIRDITGTRRLEDLAQAAVAAEHEHRRQELDATPMTKLGHDSCGRPPEAGESGGT
jgi:hypothetical protein